MSPLHPIWLVDTLCVRKKTLIEKWLYLDINAWFYIGASVCIWLNQMYIIKKKLTWRWQLTLAVHLLFFVILLNLCRSEYGWEWNEHIKPPHVRPEKVSISNPSCTLTISSFTWMDLWLPKQWHRRTKKKSLNCIYYWSLTSSNIIHRS